ncbi:hypothetical protein FE257_006414 [Aspergillus nanangensis]|uniref:Phosphoglycerate mutase family protein n=1 Tax=Aspergillus nanangensis TaxID=2582783 RepID=A0AAD4CXH9_ASPNN|nr:hypothetical protein FE257_006414 [Aspergillus nanangensis]
MATPQRSSRYQPVHEGDQRLVYHWTTILNIFQIPVIVPLLLVSTVLVAGFMVMAESPPPTKSHLKFSTVSGYFMQDESSTDPDTFDFVSSNFGLISRAYDSDPDQDPEKQKSQWDRFGHHVDQLNHDSDQGTNYRVLFMGRHGEGYHNVAEQYYGTKAWDCHWSLLDGDGNTTWVDARLTSKGESQARTAHDAFKTQLENGLPAPQSFYVSPLNRCLATASLTFNGLGISGAEPFRPVIKELLRETIGLHTCDMRSSKSTIEEEYPLYRFEPGFADEDPLFDADLRESNSARDNRLRDWLFDVLGHDKNTFISLTAHSGAITSLLKVLGHRQFPLQTGGVIPVLVKVEKVKGPAPVMEVDPPTTAPECEASI